MARKFKVSIDESKCKGCLICVHVCEDRGGKVLKGSDKKTALGGTKPSIEGDCIGCRWCERYCPDFAINVKEAKDAGTHGKNTVLCISAQEIAVELGNPIVANVVMLGALAKQSDFVNLELLKEAVESNMRPSIKEIKLDALQMGYAYLEK